MKAIQKFCFCFGVIILFAANAQAGRWLTRDPIEFMERDAPPQANLYTFVDNNPINEFDPLGLHPEVDLGVAMAQGNEELIAELVETGEGLTDEEMAGAKQWLQNRARQKAEREAEEAAAKQLAEHPPSQCPKPDMVKGKTPQKIQDMLKGWKGSPTRTPGSMRYANPAKPGEQVRVMRGNPADPNPLKQVPYARISSGGNISDPIPIAPKP